MPKGFVSRAGLALSALVIAGAAQAASFAPCADAADFPALAGSLCLRAPAPLDYARPEGEAVELFVRQFPVAQGRPPRGGVLPVARGPGATRAAV